MTLSPFMNWKRLVGAAIGVTCILYFVWSYMHRGPLLIEPIRKFQVHGPVLSVAVGPKHELLAAGTAGLDETLFGSHSSKRKSHGELTIWSEQDGKELHRCLENQWITSIAFMPNRDAVAYGKGYCRLAVADNQVPYPSFGTRGEVVILRTTDFSEVRRIALESAVYCLRASPGGKYLAVASARSSGKTFLRVYDAQTFEIVLNETFTGKVPFMNPRVIEYLPMSNLSFSPNEQLIAVGVNDSAPEILIYDLEQRKLLIRQPLNQKPTWHPAHGYASTEINVVEFEPTGRTLLVKARPRASRWKTELDSSTLKLQHVFAIDASRLILPVGNRGGVVRVLGGMGSYGVKFIASFYVPEGQLIGRLKAPVSEYTLSFAISADQRRAVAGDSDGKVHLWSLDRLQSLFSPQ